MKVQRLKEEIINWDENYLIDRKQRVVMDSFVSTLESTSLQFLEDLSLDPFFLLYINYDISTHLLNNVRLFVDDTYLCLIGDNN